ncbi:MAG TPA: tetratricopeptide repeat protein [Coleofasciculaceae cyanobacterium]|jgi:tetratricopeptide (TPR) repeat protein
MVGDKPRYELHFHGLVQNAVVGDYNNVKQMFHNSFARPTASPLHQLPLDIADFTGRQEELARLAALLRQQEPSGEIPSPSIVVTGIAGVGKSALATHIAHQLKSNFPDVQLYVNLRGNESQLLKPLEVLGSFLRALGVQSMPETLTQRSDLYRSLLSGKRALVLLDNARDEAQVLPLLIDSASCAVLVTSRRRLSALEGVNTFELLRMTQPDAVALLHKQIGVERIPVEQEATKAIVDLCGLLPLAIRLTGGTLRNEPNWQLEDYISQLTQERQRLAQLRFSNLDIRASFALSYKKLDASAARLFRFLGLLAGTNFAPGIATALLDSESATAEASVKSLVEAQLLQPADEGRYRLHDLVRLFAKEQLAQEEPAEARQAARLRAARWYLETSEIMNLALNPETRLQLAQVLEEGIDKSLQATEQSLFVKALSWFEIERINLLASIEWVHQAQAWEIVVGLAKNLVNFFNTYGYWADWEQTHLWAMEGVRTLGDRKQEAQLLTNLGNVYSLQSDWEKASECYEHSMVIFDELENRSEVAKSLGNLANVYSQQGHWDKASESYQQSLIIFSELGDGYGEAQTLANIGILHVKQGHQEKAGVLWREALTKLPSELPKSKRVAEWIGSIDMSTADAPQKISGQQSYAVSQSTPLVQGAGNVRQLETRPPERRIFYILGGFVLVIAIALFLLVVVW